MQKLSCFQSEDRVVDLERAIEHSGIIDFLIYGNMVAFRRSSMILVYPDVQHVREREYVHLKWMVKWVDDKDKNILDYPIAKFRPTELGWIYAVGFMKRFGKFEIR